MLSILIFLAVLFLCALGGLAALLLGRKSRNSFELKLCRRANYHMGPCNGFPRHTCEVYTHAS